VSFLDTRNRGAERLIGFGPLGYLFALMLEHDGHLSKIPLGLIGLMFKLAHHRTQEEAL